MLTRMNGTDLNYEVSGSGPWLTLSHALGANLHLWDGLAERFARHFTVLRFDTRGHGKSAAGTGTATMKALAGDALALLDHLGAERTIWVGLSLGGMIGQHLALDSPERVAALVLADTSPGYPPVSHPMWRERQAAVQAGGMAAVAEGTLGRWFTGSFRASHPETVEKARAMLLATPPQGFIDAVEALIGHDALERLGMIRCPTLVIVGAEDQATPLEHAQRIHQAVTGSTLRVLADAAHLSPLEQTDAFEEAVLDFLGVAACSQSSAATEAVRAQ